MAVTTDRDVSGDYWYPVAISSEVVDRPIAATLLGVRIVLCRLDGQLTALRDLCIHRGTPLSIGRIEANSLVCAYHGWRYGSDGVCHLIPQLRPEQHIPRKAKVRSYAVAERFGAIWVSLNDPRLPLPDFPEYDDPAYKTILIGHHQWQAGAARIMENFIDPSHFAFVHPGILGDSRRPEVALTPIRHSADGFDFTSTVDVPDGSGGWKPESAYTRYLMPYTLYLIRERTTAGETSRIVTLTVVRPISRSVSERYTWLARNYDQDRPDEPFVTFADTVREQDRVIVESQRPEELPLDLSDEMHLRGIDSSAVEFRRLLARTGLFDSASAQ